MAAIAICWSSSRLPQPRTPASRSNLKKRDEWFLFQRTHPLREIPRDALKKAFEQRRSIPEAESRKHGGFGPLVVPNTPFSPAQTGFDSNVAPLWGRMSGRTRDLAIDPTNPSRMFLATATGGIWRTTDAAATWTPLTDTQDSLASSAVAIDLSNEHDLCRHRRGPLGRTTAWASSSINGGNTWSLTAGPFARHAIADPRGPANGNAVLRLLDDGTPHAG
jgi:hypothetical protein